MWDPRRATDAELYDFVHNRQAIGMMEKALQDMARQELERRREEEKKS